MTSWVVFVAWVVGTLLSWRSFAIGILVSLEEDASIDGTDRAGAAFFGLLAAAAWPVSVPLRLSWRFVSRTRLLATPSEKQAAQKNELEALRRLAREHGLPMPESKS